MTYRMLRQDVANAWTVSRRRREIGIWFVLIVFFFNAVAPLGLAAQGTNGFPSTKGFAGGPDEVAILLCTSNGIKIIRFDEEGAPVRDDAGDDGFCVFCLPFCNTNIAAPDAQDSFLHPPCLLIGASPTSIDDGLLRPLVSSGSASPRAPPVSF